MHKVLATIFRAAKINNLAAESGTSAALAANSLNTENDRIKSILAAKICRFPSNFQASKISNLTAFFSD